MQPTTRQLPCMHAWSLRKAPIKAKAGEIIAVPFRLTAGVLGRRAREWG